MAQDQGGAWGIEDLIQEEGGTLEFNTRGHRLGCNDKRGWGDWESRQEEV